MILARRGVIVLQEEIAELRQEIARMKFLFCMISPGGPHRVTCFDTLGDKQRLIFEFGPPTYEQMGISKDGLTDSNPEP